MIQRKLYGFVITDDLVEKHFLRRDNKACPSDVKDEESFPKASDGGEGFRVSTDLAVWRTYVRMHVVVGDK